MATSRYEEQAYTYYDQINNRGNVSESNVVPSSRYTSWEAQDAVIHTAIQGETYRSLSLKYYQTEAYWWIIADLNPSIPIYEGAFGLRANELVEIAPRSFLP